MKTIFTFTLTLFICLQIAATAQERELPEWLGAQNSGKEYWFTVPPSFADESGGGQNFIKVYVTSPVKTLVTLEILGKNKKFTKMSVANDVIGFDLIPGDAQTFEKTGKAAEVEEKNYPGYGIHVYAEDLLVVYVLVRFRATSDGFLAVPVSSLGKEYICGSYNTDPMFSAVWGYHLPSMCGITAAYNNTRMTFTMGGNPATTTAGGLKPGQSTTITMNKGDVFMVSSKGDYGDLAGSKIVADKPVSVVSGNQCDNIPAGNQWCDYCVEMELPLFTWGNDYHVPSVPGRKWPSLMRVFAKEPNTIVFRDGKQIATLKNAGGIIGEAYYEGRITPMDEAQKPVVISGDKPIGVMVYNCGVQEDGYPLPNSDPFWMVMTPLSQYQKGITFCTPATRGGLGFEENYLNLVFQTDANLKMPDDVMIAEVKGGKYSWMPVNQKYSGIDKQFSYDFNDKHYAVRTLILPREGTFKIKASQPFAAYSFGYDWCDSYGYPTAGAFKKNDPDDKECPRVAYTKNQDESVNGTVQDKNLSLILMLTDDSYNYNLTYPEFIAGDDINTTWKLDKIDTKDSARAVIAFADRCGYDTIITIGAMPRPNIDVPKIVLSANELQFQEVILTLNKALTLTASNLGSDILQITSARITDDVNKSFNLSGMNYPLNIDINGKATFYISFIPTVLGKSTATLELLTNDPANKTIRIPLSGIGLPPSALITTNITKILFGNVKLEQSGYQNFQFINSGNTDLVINKVIITDDANNAFSIVSPPTFHPYLTKGASENLVIRFIPYQRQPYKANLHIETNAANNPILDIPIEGNGGDINDVPIVIPDNNISLSVKPNPIIKTATIEYKVNFERADLMKITVVDITGKEVVLILNQIVEPGESAVQFNAEGLAAGKYFVIANFGNEAARLPVVIEK
ncbi:MAG: hypothetical protein HW421_804 [Ignavibacteria bacterium]|nr:hypothetical protein [Ignavibacteria bacterium]